MALAEAASIHGFLTPRSLSSRPRLSLLSLDGEYLLLFGFRGLFTTPSLGRYNNSFSYDSWTFFPLPDEFSESLYLSQEIQSHPGT